MRNDGEGGQSIAPPYPEEPDADILITATQIRPLCQWIIDDMTMCRFDDIERSRDG